jgi:predicted DNA-binding transcriptional regulator AlpA
MHDNSSGYLRLPRVLDLIPVSRSTWYAGVKSGRYPKPYRISPRVSVWRADEIQDLVKGGTPSAH